MPSTPRNVALILVALIATACDEATPPDMSGLDVAPTVDVPDRDPGRDLTLWDPGQNDPGADGATPDAPADTQDPADLPDIHEGPGRISANPTELDFGTVMGGGAIDHTVTLANVGETPVSVSSVAWVDGADPDFSLHPKPGFGPLANPPTPTTLAPGESVSLLVRYAPPLETTPADVHATLRILSDSIEAPQVDVAVFARRIPRTPCVLTTKPTPLSMEFGDVPQGSVRDLAIDLVNPGTIACRVDSLILRACANATACSPEDGPASAFAWVGVPGLPFDVAPGETRSLTVRFPTGAAVSSPGATSMAFLGLTHRIDGYGLPEPLTGHLPLDCDPFGKCPANVFGRVVAPVVSVAPSSIAFGPMRVGCASATNPVTVTNVSAATVSVQEVSMDPTCPLAGEVRVTNAPAPGTALAPTQSFQIGVAWHPETEGPLACDLLIRLGAEAQAHVRVPLSGTATPGGFLTREFRMPSSDLDVLFVADGSGSMMDGVSRLEEALQTFLSATQAAGRSVQMGVVGVSAESGCADSGRLMGPVRLMTADDAYAFDDALAAIQLSSCPGNMDEQGLEAAQWALSPPLIDDTGTSCAGGGTCPVPYGCFDGVCGGSNRGLLRPDAGLDIVFFSDEEDQSPDSVEAYIDFFGNVLGAERRPGVRAFAIVGPAPEGCDNEHDTADSGARYEAVAADLGGQSFSICVPTLDAALESIATPPWDRPIVLPLDAPPSPGTVEVLRNGILCPGGFTVAEEALTVTLQPDGPCATGPGDRLTVRFHAVCEGR